MMRATSTCLVVLALAACGGDVNDPAQPWPTAAERTLAEGMAPTPFTAAQIRRACPVGRGATWRIDAVGRTPSLQSMRFLESDDAGALVESTVTELDGMPLGTPTRSRSTWAELQGHASFLEHITTISEVVVEVPAGTFACLRYVVVRGGEGATSRTVLDFAKALPGPPIRVEETLGDTVRSTMTLIEHVAGTQ